MSEARLYLLRCRDPSLYTGWTVDLERNLAATAPVPRAATASRLPVELERAIPMAVRAAARREQAPCERLPWPAKLALLNATQTEA